MKEFFIIIVEAVIKAEEMLGNNQGLNKKEKVITVLNQIIDIPIIPEFLEEKILSLLVDLIVFIFNKYKLFEQDA